MIRQGHHYDPIACRKSVYYLNFHLNKTVKESHIIHNSFAI